LIKGHSCIISKYKDFKGINVFFLSAEWKRFTNYYLFKPMYNIHVHVEADLIGFMQPVYKFDNNNTTCNEKCWTPGIAITITVDCRRRLHCCPPLFTRASGTTVNAVVEKGFIGVLSCMPEQLYFGYLSISLPLLYGQKQLHLFSFMIV
jgi:hypothetical protein